MNSTAKIDSGNNTKSIKTHANTTHYGYFTSVLLKGTPFLTIYSFYWKNILWILIKEKLPLY